MKEVNDPALLARLNASSRPGEVTDPELLERLNGGGTERSKMDYVKDTLNSTVEGLQNIGQLALDIGYQSPLGMADRLWGMQTGDTKPGVLGPVGPVGQWLDKKAAENRSKTKENYIIPEGENALFDRVKTGNRLFTETVVVPPVAKVGSTLAKTVKQLLPAVGAGVGGATAEHYWGDEGEVVGAIVGSLLGDYKNTAELLKWAGSKPVGLVKDWRSAVNAGKGELVEIDKASDSAIRESVKRLIEEMGGDADNPELVMQTIEKVKERLRNAEPGTLGQLSGNENILAIEKQLRNAPEAVRPLQQTIRQIDQAIENNVLGDLDSLAGDVSTEGLTARARQLADADAQGVVETAEQAAEATRQEGKSALAQTMRMREMSTEAGNLKIMRDAAPAGVDVTAPGREGMRQLQEGFRAGYDDFWKDAVKHPLLMENMKTYGEMLKNTVRGKFEGRFDRILDDVEKLADQGPEGLRRIHEGLGELAYGNSDAATQMAARDLRKIFRAHLPDDVRAGLDALDAQYPKFKTVQKAQNKTDPSKGNLFNAKDYWAAQKVVMPEAQVASGRASTMPLADEFMDEAMRLDEAERVAKETNAAAGKEATQRLRDAEREAKALRESKPLGRFGQYEDADIDKAVRELYGTPKSQGQRLRPSESLAELARLGDGDPQVREQVRRALTNEMFNSTTKDGHLTRDAYNLFKSRRPALEKSGLFTVEELDRLDQRFAEGQKLFLHENAKELAALARPKRNMLIASAQFLGAKIGAGLSGGVSLVGATIGSARAKEMIEAATSTQLRDLQYQLLVNPERFVKEVEKYFPALAHGGQQTEQAVVRIWERLLEMASRPAVIVGAENVEE